MGIEEDIDRLRGLGDGVPTRAPQPGSWWWGKRYVLLAVGMALSVGATLGLSRLGSSGSDEVTAGPGSSTTTTTAAAGASAVPGKAATATTAPPPAGGTTSPGDPDTPETTTTTYRSTAQPSRAGSTPVTVPTGSNPRPPTTTTTAPGPPWRANSISLFPPGTVVAGESVEFGVSVRGLGDLYQVAFGDGSSTGSASSFACDDYSLPSAYRHTFANPGHYTFTVRIHGSGSCTTLSRDWRTTTKTISFDVVAPS